MTNSTYIHIPFCVKKCNYCAFVSYNKLQLKKAYINALIKEISTNYKGEKLKTIYFGGGTPSLLTLDEISNILSFLNFDTSTEITFEVNPNKLTPQYLANIRKIGINRLSIGAQDFNESILTYIGRLHSPNDIKIAVKNAKNAGFENISLDLIYGLPNQAINDFEFSLKCAISLEVQHISLYGLKIEDGTEFGKNPPTNLPDDDMQADMYLLACDFLRNNGYNKYEISNFAIPNFDSRHNLNYWNAQNYYGFGCGAHGYEGNIRYENQTNLHKYIESPQKKLSITQLTQQDQLEERIFLGFRKAEGINTQELKSKFNHDFEKTHEKNIAKFLASGHLTKTDYGYALSDTGFLLSNVILSHFI